MKLRKFSVLVLFAFCLTIATASAYAESSSVSLNPVATVKQGGTVAISGTSTLDEVIIKVLRPGNNDTVFFDIVPVTDGQFSSSFKLLSSEAAGTYTIVAGQADEVATQSLVVTATEVVVPPLPPINPIITPPGEETEDGGLDLMIDGVTLPAIAKATTSEQDGKTVLTATVDADKLSEQLENAANRAVVTIPVTADSDKVSAVLSGDAIQAMENKDAVLHVQTPIGSYKLPASEMKLELLAQLLGGQGNQSEITVQVDIAKSDEVKVELLADAAGNGSFTVVVPPIDFTVTATLGDRSVTLDTFSSYVEREIPLPEGVDASKVTTAIVLNADGTTRSVPTKFVTRDGVTYAVINSLTNSTYSLIWNPVAFADIEGHWAKEAVNHMGSRMIISGTGDNLFSPDRDITRAEFAAIVVRSLGLNPDNGTGDFSDVRAGAWYSDAVNTASGHGLIGGFEDGTFRPNDKITREQAMVIIAKAMELTNLEGVASGQSAEEALLPYSDAENVSSWAKSGVADSVQAGIVTGKENKTLAPQDFILRAEVATIIERLLRNSDLI